MAKKLDSKTKRTVNDVREAKRGPKKALTGAAKTTTKSAQSATQQDPGAISPKTTGAKSTQATKKSTRATAKPRGAVRRSTRAGAVACGPAPTFEQIRDRAYGNYLKRGDSPGDAASDWLQAERELRQLPAAHGGVFT